jgi:hypothetical protein
MSEIRLTLLDSGCTLTGKIDAAVGAALVAALSAEPNNVRELKRAVARFRQPVESRHPFSSLCSGCSDEPWDTGILLIDFTAHIVAEEITDSQPMPGGMIQYYRGVEKTDIWLPYKIPDDWLYLGTIAEYKAIAEARKIKYERIVPIDTRKVLYGQIADFIVRQCFHARKSDLDDPVATIHADWLMTSRKELGGQTPRQVLMSKFEFINADMQSREMQWSMLNLPAPCLELDSHAYRYAGFGIHAFVVYYDLVRHLIENCWDHICETQPEDAEAEIRRLEQVKAKWLETPDPDFGDRSPAYILECERKRLPLIMSAEEAVVDDDCPLCRMMAEHDRPTFCHFDGSGMDDDFPYSFCLTRDEWEAENRRREKFAVDFEKHWKHRKDASLEDDDPSQPGDTVEIQ